MKIIRVKSCAEMGFNNILLGKCVGAKIQYKGSLQTEEICQIDRLTKDPNIEDYIKNKTQPEWCPLEDVIGITRKTGNVLTTR
jgi:hypothetical protein